MTANGGTGRLKPIDVTASEATLFIPTPLHPKSEAYADKVFKRCVRPGVDGLSRDECLALADAALIRIGPMNAADIHACKKLKIIARNGTGYDAIDLPACRETGVVVTNMPGGNAPAVGELTIALALAVLRRVVELNNRIRAGERVPSINALAPGLLGKTVGLIGMGDIAYQAAKLFSAFGCKILAYSPTSPATRWKAGDDRFEPLEHERISNLDESLQRADVVSIHCPKTPQTQNLIGKAQLEEMKPGAVIINTSRGGIIDEDALAVAIRSGHIGGAGLDVMKTEPAFGENLGPLRDLPNVVILPHLGGSTDATAEAGCTAAINIVVDYLAGKGARNRVDGGYPEPK